MGKTALITGVTGQDGAYLAKLLLEKGYEVHGTYHRPAFDRLDYLGVKADIELQHLELLEESSCRRAVNTAQPDEIYHLAARSFVGDSFKAPATWLDVNARGTLYLLQASEGTRFYFAATSEMFGRSPPPQDESTPLCPCSPYGIAKVAAYSACRNYREEGWPVSCGILFNHESPLRGQEFVTSKIIRALVRRETVNLGNLNSKRDWGHAEDYVRAMWLMMQHPPDDFVIATGKSYTVLEFLTRAEEIIGHSLDIRIDSSLVRPTEVDYLCGDAKKAFDKLGWHPKHDLDSLIEDMINAASVSDVPALNPSTAVGR